MIAVAKRKNIDPSFGRRLRELREAADLTQTALAALLKTKAPVIARLEAGGREPGWQTVRKLAAALGVTPDAFLEPGGTAAE